MELHYFTMKPKATNPYGNTGTGVPLDSNVWEAITAAVIKDDAYGTATVPQICKASKEGYDAALVTLAKETILPTTRDKELRRMLFDQLIKNSELMANRPTYGDSDDTNLDLYCREHPYEVAMGIEGYVDYLLSEGRHLDCAENLYNPLVFAKGINKHLRDMEKRFQLPYL